MGESCLWLNEEREEEVENVEDEETDRTAKIRQKEEGLKLLLSM